MKKVAILLWIAILGTFVSKGQERDCANTKVYDLTFKEMNLYEKKATDIEIGYTPHESVIEIIDKLNMFNDKEMKQFNNLPKDVDYQPCIKFRRQIELILSNEKIKENGSYVTYLFSKIISFSDSKKSILSTMAARNKNYEGGKIIGGEIIYVFERKNEKWELIDKKLLAMY